MDPLETLSNEHGLIRQYLDNLSMAGDKIENGQRPSAAFFEKAIEFARNFADKYHHIKEEHMLFVRLAQKRKGELDAQLDTLRFQHERGRELVTAMANSIDGYVAHDEMKTSDLLQSMAAYGALLRRHIHTEDHIFYPMARKALGEEEMEQLAVEFDKERAKRGGGTFEHSHKLVVDMGSIVTHLS